jgi:hypothetical protein
VGREICQREGLQGLLLGSIAKLGNKYVLVTRLESPSGGEILSAEKFAGTAENIPARVDEIAKNVRHSLAIAESVKENSGATAKVTGVAEAIHPENKACTAGILAKRSCCSRKLSNSIPNLPWRMSTWGSLMSNHRITTAR